MNWARKIWRQFIVTLPIWMMVSSLVLFLIGFNFDDGNPAGVRNQRFSYAIASAVLSGGVFAAVLKSMQFLNIFEDAVRNIILLDQSWLKTLAPDKLRGIWRDVVAVTVEKGFPQLSDRLRENVFDHVIPKLGNFYYSKMNRRIELYEYDECTDILKIRESYELVINSHGKDTVIPYIFKLIGECPSVDVVQPYTITFLQINGRDHANDVKYATSPNGREATVEHSIQLSGEEFYSIHREMERVTRVSGDPVLNMVATRFTDSMIVLVDNRVAQYIEVDALPVGITTEGFRKTHPGSNATKWHVTQLMFPGDGLTLIFKKAYNASMVERSTETL